MLDWMKPEDMKEISELLSKKFDFVLVDCPAGVEDGFKNALAACKEAIVVTNPELSAVRDADRVIGILNTSDIEPIQLVINRVRPNMMASQEMLSIEDLNFLSQNQHLVQQWLLRCWQGLCLGLQLKWFCQLHLYLNKLILCEYFPPRNLRIFQIIRLPSGKLNILKIK